MTATDPQADADALVILRTVTHKRFAMDLIRQYDASGCLSERQMAWVHTLAGEEIARREAEKQALAWQSKHVEAVVMDEDQMAGILNLFAAAGEQLKNPRVRLLVGDTDPYRNYALRPCLRNGPNAGSIELLYYPGDGWRQSLGRITPDGLFLPAVGVTASDHPGLIERMLELSADPVKVAKEYGRLMGSCCFCGLPLTDERSVDAGFGPICAAKWSLEWGGKSNKPAVKVD